MGSQPTAELELWLAEEWASRFAQAIAAMTGESPPIQCEAAPLSAEIVASSDHLWWQQTFTPWPEAFIWVGAARRCWEEIGKRILTSAGIEDSSADDAKSTYQEVLNQSLSGVAQALALRLRKDVVCGPGSREAPGESTIPAFSVALSFAAIEVRIELAFSPGLISILNQPTKPSYRPAIAAPQSSPTTAAEPHSGKSIDLLLDVELPVSISFGRAQLLLKDVIKLTTGSIVELNRTVSEPVDVIVNNCVIARGQVVVVEGNFGIRIEHVISRQERLRTFK
jgi:flagellar motor switch protein FliN